MIPVFRMQTYVPVALLIPLAAMLYGCQPEATASQAVATADASTEAVVKFAQDTGCFACHAIDKKLLGPAWKTVAAMYRGDPEGETKLMDKIARGGSGVWGSIAMPAYPNLGEAERRMLVRYILSLE